MALLRRASTVASLTLASRLLGFARDAGVAALFGTGMVAEASVAGLALAQLVRRLLGEGAMNAAVLPRLAGLEGEARRQRAGAALLLVGLAASGAAVLLFLAMPQVIALMAPGFDADGPRADAAIWAGRLTVICVPLALIAGTAAALANAGGAIAGPALGPALANIVVLGLLAALALSGAQAMDPLTAISWLAAGVIAGAVTQLALNLLSMPVGGLARPGRAALRAALPILAAAGPSLFAAGLPQLRFLVAAAAASAVPGGIAALFYATRLVELPLGLIGASTGAVLLPALAAARPGAAEGQEDVAEGVSHDDMANAGLEASLALALPAAFGLAVLAHPIVVVLFQRGAFDPAAAELTATALALLALTLPFQAAEKILAAMAFAAGLGRDVTRAALAGLVAGGVAGFLAVGPLGLAGPALGVLAGSAVSLGALALGLARRRLWRVGRQTRGRLLRLLGAGLAMAAAVETAALGLAGPLIAGGVRAAGALGLLILLGMAVYAGAALLSGAVSPTRLRAGLRKAKAQSTG